MSSLLTGFTVINKKYLNAIKKENFSCGNKTTQPIVQKGSKLLETDTNSLWVE